MVRIKAEQPRGCMDCPFRHYVPGEEEEYDICGLSGKDIPFYVNQYQPDYHMDSCMIVWDGDAE